MINLLRAAIRLMERSPMMEMKHAEHVRHIRSRYHLVAERQKGKIA